MLLGGRDSPKTGEIVGECPCGLVVHYSNVDCTVVNYNNVDCALVIHIVMLTAV